MGLIYISTNKVNGKSYIGKTYDSLECRKSNHKWFALNNLYDVHFHRAIRKYGFDKFEWNIIEDNIDKNDLEEKEVYYVDKFDTFKNGYNMTIGGEKNYSLSEESKKKISDTHRGKKLSKETKLKISNSVKNLYTDEYRKLISIKTKKAMLNPEVKRRLSISHKGHKHSEETKKKMIESKSKKYIIHSPENQVYEIKNLKQFCLENDLNNSCMCNVAMGRRKNHKGWICERSI